MLTTFWAVARALFVFITTMFLPIFCSKLSFKITLKLKENSTFFCSSATCPGDIFYPDFADGKPTYFDISVRNSLLPQFLSRVSFTAGIASSVGKMHRDAKYNYSVSCSGCAFFPLVVKTLGKTKIQVFPSYAALLFLLLSVVMFPKLRLSIIYYNSCQ